MIINNATGGCVNHRGNMFAYVVGRKRIGITDKFGVLLTSFIVGSEPYSICFSNDDTKIYMLTRTARILTVVNFKDNFEQPNITSIKTGISVDECVINSMICVSDEYVAFIGVDRKCFTHAIYMFNMVNRSFDTIYKSENGHLFHSFQYNAAASECLVSEVGFIDKNMGPALIYKIPLEIGCGIKSCRKILFKRMLLHPCEENGENICYACYYDSENEILIATTRCIEIYINVDGRYLLKSAYYFSTDESSTNPMTCSGVVALRNYGYIIIDQLCKNRFLLFSMHDMCVVKIYNKSLFLPMQTLFLCNTGEMLISCCPDDYDKKGIDNYHIVIGDIKSFIDGIYDDILYAEY